MGPYCRGYYMNEAARLPMTGFFRRRYRVPPIGCIEVSEFESQAELQEWLKKAAPGLFD
jgi:hypothetical protein